MTESILIQKTLNISGNLKHPMKSCIFRYDTDFEPVKLAVGL